jgi:hypothetical protein
LIAAHGGAAARAKHGAGPARPVIMSLVLSRLVFDVQKYIFSWSMPKGKDA